MVSRSAFSLCFPLILASLVKAFTVGPYLIGSRPRIAANTVLIGPNAFLRSNTALYVLLDVPDGFFTVTFPMLGILLGLSKSFARVRMEENAWEQRLEEGRKERLRRDPSLTELDLRRMEAELEWSAYGENQQQMEQEKQSKRRVKVKSRNRDEPVDPRRHRMTDEEIQDFEVQYGVDYDPYYDDPYSEDELPDEKYSVDKRYGDRVYGNGEIFYKDVDTGLFYRQGAKPRNLSFWK